MVALCKVPMWDSLVKSDPFDEYSSFHAGSDICHVALAEGRSEGDDDEGT